MKTTEDLTAGVIEKQLILLVLPLILGNIFQQMYNTVDSFIIGRYLGHTAFAAVGVAGSLMNLFIFIVNGGCNGMAIIFAELFGEKSWDTLRRESFLSFFLGFLVTVGLTVAGLSMLIPLLRIMQTPEEVQIFVRDYLRIIYMGLPVTFLYNWCSAILRAVGDTKTPLWALVTAMILNFGLDYLFVVSCGSGIAGTALATVISQLFASAICFIYMRIRHPYLLFSRKDMALDRGLLRKTANYGMVSALHQSGLYIGKLFVQGAVNTAGTEIISAFTMTARIEGFANSFGDSGAMAISVFIAQNHGAGNRDRAKQGFKKATWMLATLSICLSVLMVVVTPGATGLLMGDVSDTIYANVEAYMKTIATFYILCFIGSSFVGLYRGLGMVRIPVIGTLIHIPVRVVFSYLFIGKLGLAAVAIATGIGWAAVVGYFCIVYKKSAPQNLRGTQ